MPNYWTNTQCACRATGISITIEICPECEIPRCANCHTEKVKVKWWIGLACLDAVQIMWKQRDVASDLLLEFRMVDSTQAGERLDYRKSFPFAFNFCLTSLHRKRLLVKLNALWLLSSTTCSRSIRPLLCILFPRKTRKVLKHIYFFCQSYFSVRPTSLGSMRK
jgi:hypothetical protein